MPDGGSVTQDFQYRPAMRGKAATLTMFAGPSGTGKTYSALKFARGLAGPTGKICLADTENRRARFYADELEFDHLEVVEPFRPSKFEQAAVRALEQGADVWVCDSFSHEHTGPGGLLDYFETEMQRMLAAAMRQERNRNASEWDLRNSLNFTAWIKPKSEHKHMLQRLWQLNCHIVLCCHAEKKIELKKNPQKHNRIEPNDRGLQPICGNDIPYAMTMSFLLASTETPGVPTVIKPLMPSLRPLIDLTKPIDEAFGARIALWARGEKPDQDRQPTSVSKPAASKAASKAASTSAASNEAAKSDTPSESTADPGLKNNPEHNAAPEPPPAGDEAGATDPAASGPPEEPPPHPGDGQSEQPARPPADDSFPGDRPSADPDEEKVKAGAQALADKFLETADRKAHLALTDDAEIRGKINWLRKKRKDIYDRVLDPAIRASWARTDPKAAQQSNLGLGGTA